MLKITKNTKERFIYDKMEENIPFLSNFTLKLIFFKSFYLSLVFEKFQNLNSVTF